jgi:hypothetical protein
MDMKDMQWIKAANNRGDVVCIRLDQIASYEMMGNGQALQVNLIGSPLHHLVKDARAVAIKEALDEHFDDVIGEIEVKYPAPAPPRPKEEKAA